MTNAQRMAEIRQAFADYAASEGCGCCQNVEAHHAALMRLGALIGIPAYEDGSGIDFYKFTTARS